VRWVGLGWVNITSGVHWENAFLEKMGLACMMMVGIYRHIQAALCFLPDNAKAPEQRRSVLCDVSGLLRL
jgi:hypothetical protein